MTFIQELVAEKKGQNEIVAEVTKVCISLQIESNRICQNVTVEFRVRQISLLKYSRKTLKDVAILQ